MQKNANTSKTFKIACVSLYVICGRMFSKWCATCFHPPKHSLPHLVLVNFQPEKKNLFFSFFCALRWVFITMISQMFHERCLHTGALSLHFIKVCGNYSCITMNNYFMQKIIEEKFLFWLVVSEVLIHSPWL